jgi:hypothetical protein
MKEGKWVRDMGETSMARIKCQILRDLSPTFSLVGKYDGETTFLLLMPREGMNLEQSREKLRDMQTRYSDIDGNGNKFVMFDVSGCRVDLSVDRKDAMEMVCILSNIV